MKTNIIKPKLIDYSLYQKKTIIKSISPIEIYQRKIFYINLIMILILILCLLFLYYRYETKERDKKNTQFKIKELYKQMINYK